MTPKEILEKEHRSFSKDTEYPEEDNEMLLRRVDWLNDGIDEWEAKIDEGIYWSELLVSGYEQSFGGTGTDALPDDFRSFYRRNNEDDDASVICVGSACYREVTPAEGARAVQSGYSPYIFWREGANIRTLPALSGSVLMPYVRKATRYVTGLEETDVEMSNPSFLVDYVRAQEFVDNEDDTLYQVAANAAQEKLNGMIYRELGSLSE